jgi:ubiquitin C-terminal hydrolase
MSEDIYTCFDLSLPFPVSTKSHSLPSLILEYFKSETVEYACPCGAPTSIKKKLVIQFPDVLTIHFMRFGSAGDGAFGKRHDSVELPDRLVLGGIDENEVSKGLECMRGFNVVDSNRVGLNGANEEATYILKGIICHLGETREKGHYVCHVKGDQGWKLIDDDETTKEDGVSGEKCNVYFLAYVRDK